MHETALVGSTGRPTWTSSYDRSICVYDVYRVTTYRPGRGQGSSRTGTHGNAVPVLFLYNGNVVLASIIEKRLKMRINDSRNKKLVYLTEYWMSSILSH